ncbi:hypothetical protein PsorP6_014985 [Peronosclerospora sorghi]|uniref:Uncharacterized protein n=1 Tax=Peronosclerospora sorghi TaxID=230839 RepID=A0ACC0VS74_9STRA|nr:hypothetical protein PsorP6_014985 [Peronosclerospora sorghi]
MDDDALKPVEDDEVDTEPDQFLADLPPPGRADVAVLPASTSALQSTPCGSTSVVSEPQERRAQVGASPYIAPFTPGGSPPLGGNGAMYGFGPTRPKTPSSSGGRTSSSNRVAKPQLVPVTKAATAFGSSPALPRDDVVNHLPPKLLETLVDVIRTLDQLADGVANFRPDQLRFLSDKATRYVEILHETDKAAAAYHADIPLQVLAMLDAEDGSNPELFTKTQLEKCREESDQVAAKAETLELLKQALQAGMEQWRDEPDCT